MVSARSTTFLLLLVFILLLPLRFSFSCADTQHQGDNAPAVDSTGSKIERSLVNIEADKRKRVVPGITGRKMMLISKSENVVESENINVVAKGSSSTTKKSSDHYFVPLNADYHDPRHHPPKNN